ncbi:unnamed protein product, partial [marine sediment metagenome]
DEVIFLTELSKQYHQKYKDFKQMKIEEFKKKQEDRMSFEIKIDNIEKQNNALFRLFKELVEKPINFVHLKNVTNSSSMERIEILEKNQNEILELFEIIKHHLFKCLDIEEE